MNISGFTLSGSMWLQVKSQSMQFEKIFLGKHASSRTPLVGCALHACLTQIVPFHTLCHPCYSIYGHIFSDLGYAAVWLLPTSIHSYHDYYDAHQLQIRNEGDSILASFPGHSQILSRSCGENLGSCEIKSGSGLGTRLPQSMN